MLAASFLRRLSMASTFALALGTFAFAQIPKVGAKAPNFTLNTITGTPVELLQQEHGNPLVLVVLRGYPGYQCPFCVRQVHDFAEHAADFATKNATVLFIYPGPPADLDAHAREFLAKQANLPTNIVLVTDPDYKVTNLYGLRWNAPKETAYPTTFILDSTGKILYEETSRVHGDRVSAQDALKHLTPKKSR